MWYFFFRKPSLKSSPRNGGAILNKQPSEEEEVFYGRKSSNNSLASLSGLSTGNEGDQKILRSGWLRKQGGMIKTWNERWFVLRKNRLNYYKEQDESKLLVRAFNLLKYN